VAEETAAEIRSSGGDAIASTHDITDWDGGRGLVDAAVSTFGRLDVLVNNAGILRDRMLVSMSEDEWDQVVDVHLKGHFVPTRFAAVHWREQVKAGATVNASIIHTSSTSGLLGNPGQTNYGAAKAGIGSFSIICAQELSRYGVRSNCIAPAARTRLTEATPGLGEVVAAPSEGFDVWDPANVSPLVAYLATAGCDITGRTFFVQGGTVRLMEPWRMGERLERDERWTIDDLGQQLPSILG
jgi:NAD(P)-dependent dehydrogenase (short-subunit alcohol dehydrogenase family)